MEVWIKAKGFPSYEVSNTGQIRNAKTGRILKQYKNQRGYMITCLHENGVQHARRVHRLIADAFFDGDHDGLDVNHIDGRKTNNHISNLEFCTRKQNIAHAFETGLKKPSRQIKIRVVETGEVYESIRECGRSIGCDQSIICACLNGKQKSCNGYHFEKV